MFSNRNFLYNPFKHHLSFIRAEINKNDINSLLPLIKTLGNSKMDIYFGDLSLSDLSDQIISLIPANNKEEFKQWTNAINDYQTVQLSDKSEWIVRFAEEEAERYVHLHPGRYTAFTFRINANVLKTAILAVASLKHGDTHVINTESINEIRKSYLKLSPIQDLNRSEQLKEVLDRFM